MSERDISFIPSALNESIEEFGKGDQSEGDESQYAVLAIIIAIGIGAAIFYLKGYKPKR